jgi:hypothetical protein
VITNISLTLYTLICLFFMLEAFFMFVPQIHSSGYSLASQIWYRRYFRPINSDGFRDKDFTLEASGNKKKIFVIGDSFVAGQGIKNINDRFSNILEERCSNNYFVFNLGIIGVNTREEYEILSYINDKYKADLLILGYFCNDIDDLAGPLLTKWNQPYQELNFSGVFFIHSYFLNYIYWQFPHQNFNEYKQIIQKTYENPEIMKKQEEDLQKFIDYSHKNSVPLVVILFPYLQDIKESKSFLSPIKDFFIKRKVPVINVIDLITDISPEKLTVSKRDAHPNEFLNKIVADELYVLLKKEGYIKD